MIDGYNGFSKIMSICFEDDDFEMVNLVNKVDKFVIDDMVVGFVG